jgi:uncharacterized protein YciI
MATAPTPSERETIGAHFEYLKQAYETGRVVYVGRTLEPPLLGLAILEAVDADAARAFFENDPAVKAGLFRGGVQAWQQVFPAREA